MNNRWSLSDLLTANSCVHRIIGTNKTISSIRTILHWQIQRIIMDLELIMTGTDWKLRKAINWEMVLEKECNWLLPSSQVQNDFTTLRDKKFALNLILINFLLHFLGEYLQLQQRDNSNSNKETSHKLF